MPSRTWFCGARVSRKASGEERASFDQLRTRRPRRPLSRRLANRSLLSRSLRLMPRPRASSLLMSRRSRARRASLAAVAIVGAAVPMPRLQPRGPRRRTRMRRPTRFLRGSLSASRRRRASPIVRRSRRLCRSASAIPRAILSASLEKKPESAAADTAARQPESAVHGEVWRLPLPAF